MEKVLISMMLVFLTAGFSHAENRIAIKDAWVREVPPASSITAVYFTIENQGNEDDKLVDVSSEISGSAEIHVTTVDDKSVAKMEMKKEIDIPKGETIELKPGGAHIMLIDLKEPLTDKNEIDLDLTFAKAGDVEIKAVVLGIDDDHGKHNHH
ncbi:MAG: copper chaperone PCu(A)C [Deltaproteobacteria bacterium]